MSLLDTCFTVEHLHESFNDIRKNIYFKYSVQYYRLNELTEIVTFREAYVNGTFSFSKGQPFKLSERGRERYIQPIVFRDRVVIHAFCKYVLLPKVLPLLIYDNCASIKGKGIDKSIDRLKTHLKRYFHEHRTNQGYILQIDCRKYFDNLRHDVIIHQFSTILNTEELQFLKLILKENEVDSSYLPKTCMNDIFDAIEYSSHYYPKNGLSYMKKSVGIGSEVSQVIGLYYLSKIDNYIKIVKGFKYYARYMDDSYVIYHDKETLQLLLVELNNMYNTLGLFINKKKTQINRLDKSIIFLKTIFYFSKTGKVELKKSKDTFKRERKKLKKFYCMIDKGELTFEMVRNQYKSWRGTITRKNKNSKRPMFKNKKQIQSMDLLYLQLFKEVT